MSNKKKIKETKLSKLLKAPLRFLIKARDLYIQSLTECATAGHVGYGYGSIMGCPTGQVYILPRSYSVSSCSSRDEDFRELVRVASTKKLQLDKNHMQSPSTTTTTTTTIGGNRNKSGMVMLRSFSTGIGKIDEDKPYEFGDDDDVKVTLDVLPRSRSYAVSRRIWFV